jgi:hypothetical protein
MMTAIGLLATAPAAADKLPRRLAAMTPEAFSAAITPKGDALEPAVTLSTEQGYHPSPRSPIAPLLTDNHLRALVDRESGAVRYEVHQSIRYWGARRSYVAVHYEGADGIVEKPLLAAHHSGDHCPNEDNWHVCSLSKRMSFEIGEDELRTIAARYAPGNAERWAFRLRDESGQDWHDAIVPAEAAGLLMAVDRYRATLR